MYISAMSSSTLAWALGIGFVVFTGVPLQAADQKAEVSKMRIEDLSKPGALIGMLAVPLGKVVAVEGEIVDGDTQQRKALAGTMLLQVKSVEGRQLPEPRLLRFAWLSGTSSKELTGQVKLIGYESGRFTGVPAEAFEYVDRVATEGFHFESTFVILKSR